MFLCHFVAALRHTASEDFLGQDMPYRSVRSLRCQTQVTLWSSDKGSKMPSCAVCRLSIFGIFINHDLGEFYLGTFTLSLRYAEALKFFLRLRQDVDQRPHA